jgi:hypothetical protein
MEFFMKYIKEFNHFDNKLYVFDLDDTLVKTPSFESIARKYIKESNLPTVYDLLNKSVDAISVSIDDLKWENGRIFIQDSKIEPVRNWVRKKNRLYLTSPDLFSYIDEGMPYETKSEILEIYKKVDKKVILTARPEGSRKKIEEVIKELGIEFPSHGLIMRPDKLKNAGKWKGEELVKFSKKFNDIVFYDDNARYIKEVKKVWFDNNLTDKEITIIKVN